MKNFVKDVVWPKLKDYDDMYCPLTGKPIVDMFINVSMHSFVSLVHQRRKITDHFIYQPGSTSLKLE